MEHQSIVSLKNVSSIEFDFETDEQDNRTAITSNAKL